MRTRLVLLLLASGLSVFIFWMGFIMGKVANEQNIIAALKSNDTKTAFFMWNKMKADGIEVTKYPLFFLSAAKSMLNRGDLEGVRFNLDKIVDLMGK